MTDFPHNTMEQAIESAAEECACHACGDIHKLTPVYFAAIISKHLVPPWLDVPDGPGHYWRQEGASLTKEFVTAPDAPGWKQTGVKYQHILAPTPPPDTAEERLAKIAEILEHAFGLQESGDRTTEERYTDETTYITLLNLAKGEA